MRIVNFLLAVMFLAFASLQLNDPDPVAWILIYGLMAVVCVMAIFEMYSRKLMLGLAIVFIVYCILLWPGVSEWLQQDDKGILFDEIMTMKYPYIEESREFLGLVISLLVLTFYFFRSRRSMNAT